MISRTRPIVSAIVVSAMAWLFVTDTSRAEGPLGAFAHQAGVGQPMKTGSATFDAGRKTYTVTGGGRNMWARTDAFQFVWKPMAGNVQLAADVNWLGAGKDPHRKACLMIRQSLDADAAYVDAALHGDGLTSLQYREDKGGLTYEIRARETRPGRLQIRKEGNRFSLSVGSAGQAPRPAGGSITISMHEPFYVGLAVCAHDDRVTETAEFANVTLSSPAAATPQRPEVESTLEVVDLASRNRQVIFHERGLFEAPNWAPDGRWFLINRGGQIFRLPVTGGSLTPIETGEADHCNNDHGLSPDGKQLAISHHGADRRSRIYLVPSGGGRPKLLTPEGPSYWHGWSPDGKTIVYCAERNREFDVYSIPAEGGVETRLTTAPGLDDGPEFSPDGKTIYFNSIRTGRMQIWRMNADGSGQTAVTSDRYNNWFPHPSPDGKWLVFLSYEPEVVGHPANQEVLLRVMPTASGPIQILARVFGGQGTINVPSWAPDSRKLAFVSYLVVTPESSGTGRSGSP